ncbi:MAG: SufD family Fe-S cluster assembly protein [Candidatus Micrarchaeota archaeon]|nr:SufD family Fe-S cluster assembly protein [Candidatus Micrarchaeota archaeon]
MGFYETFVTEAAESYAKLPEETNSLYKKHHVTVGQIPDMQENEKAEIAAMNDFLNANTGRFGTGFDAVIGSSTVLVNNKIVTVGQPKSSENLLNRMMHSSKDDRYTAFINANSKRTIVINVEKGVHQEVKLLFLNHDQPLLSHVFMNAGADSKAKVVEVYASSATKSSTMATIHEISSGDNSTFELDAIHNENAGTTLLSFCKNNLGSHSNFRFNTFYNGSQLARIRNVINATSPGSNVEVNEVVFGSKVQKFDIATQIHNQGRESNASLESKAVLMDTSSCLLKGFAKVLKGASGARSYVHERGILLDRGARVDGLPDMSVEESNVKATHSSATAPIDQETVFYLMSKGIPEIGVKKLIVAGFLGEIISKMHSESARSMAIELINHKLETREFGVLPETNPENAWMFGEEKGRDMFMGHYKYR